MPQPTALVLLKSIHRRNTEKVARAIADVLGADVVAPEDATSDVLARYELFGFGSGIYFGRLHGALRSWVDGLQPQAQRLPAFVFSTAGTPALHKIAHWDLKRKLSKAGFDTIGEFNCAGYDTFGLLRLVGGLNRGRPNEADLARAGAFARSLVDIMAARAERSSAQRCTQTT
jgi:flavodoxin